MTGSAIPNGHIAVVQSSLSALLQKYGIDATSIQIQLARASRTSEHANAGLQPGRQQEKEVNAGIICAGGGTQKCPSYSAVFLC